MFAIYATQAAPDDPLSALVVGELPQPAVREGWVRVKISHASLNRHDLFTLRGITAHPEGISFPMILGNDEADRPWAAQTLDARGLGDGAPRNAHLPRGNSRWVFKLGAVRRV